MIELFAIGEQVKDEDFHGVVPLALSRLRPREAFCREG
jgi:hypothetical protein